MTFPQSSCRYVRVLRVQIFEHDFESIRTIVDLSKKLALSLAAVERCIVNAPNSIARQSRPRIANEPPTARHCSGSVCAVAATGLGLQLLCLQYIHAHK